MQAFQIFKKIPNQALKKAEIDQVMARLNLQQTWKYNQKNDVEYITRQVKLSNFKSAMQFMQQVGFVAENMIHHPEWSNVWNTVNIDLTTHDTNGLSLKDFYLAYSIDKITEEFSGYTKEQFIERYNQINTEVLRNQNLLEEIQNEINKLA